MADRSNIFSIISRYTRIGILADVIKAEYDTLHTMAKSTFVQKSNSSKC